MNFMREAHQIQRGSRLARLPLYERRRARARGRLFRDDVDVGPLIRALDAKFDDSIGGGEQRVIGAHTDIDAGAINGAALTDEDIARKHILATELLDAQALGV